MKTPSTDSCQIRERRFSRYDLMISAGLALAVAFGLPVAANAVGKPAAVIKMTDQPPRFVPAKVTVAVGDTVEWINNAQVLHSVDADPSMVQSPKDVVLPKGVKPFDSGFMPPGATYSYTFTVPGIYKYTCLPHEKDAMDGTIVVRK